MAKLHLIDAYSFLYRAYHALPPLTSPQNIPIGAVYGYVNMLLKLLKHHKPEYIAAIFDSGGATFRNNIYGGYKLNRGNKKNDLYPQFQAVREATAAMGISGYEEPGFEADDIIGTFATKAAQAGHEVIIVSSDKDLMQLIDDKICMFDPMKNQYIHPDHVFQKFGVEPSQIPDLLAIWGDVSDNVPGIPGVGMKGAAELLRECRNLEGVLHYADELPASKKRDSIIKYADQGRMSLQLTTLALNVPIEFNIDEMKPKDYVETLWEFAHLHEFMAISHDLTYVREERRRKQKEGLYA